MVALRARSKESEDRHARDRAIMIARHLAARGIADPLVLAAMGEVPREGFVPEHLQEFAYEDGALPIEAGQTISQPYIVARMIELAEVKAGDKVLEVGAGSGYAAAVLGRIAEKVYALERHPELAAAAQARLKRLGYNNVEIICRDGTKGLPEQAPAPRRNSYPITSRPSCHDSSMPGSGSRKRKQWRHGQSTPTGLTRPTPSGSKWVPHRTNDVGT